MFNAWLMLISICLFFVGIGYSIGVFHARKMLERSVKELEESLKESNNA